jgi:hypothetical protein
MIPEVSPDVIDNMLTQQKRDGTHNYVVNKFEEMYKDNPDLAAAILQTAKRTSERIVDRITTGDIEYGNEEEPWKQIYLLIADNIVATGVSVYNAIQQQMICNELEQTSDKDSG